MCSASSVDLRQGCERAPNTEGFFWATQARGVERCVWEQAGVQGQWSEWATADGHAVFTILFDLVKAFDHVAYGAHTFPVRQLKLLLQVYQAARHVELDGVAGEELQGRRGIILGCAFATTFFQHAGDGAAAGGAVGAPNRFHPRRG